MLALNKENLTLFSPTELCEHPHIENSSMPELWSSWFKSAGIEVPNKRSTNLHVQNSAQVIEVLQSGDSIGLIDRNFIKNDIKSGRLAIACEHVLQGEDGYFLTAPQSAEMLPSFQCFKDWLNSQLNTSSHTENIQAD